MKRLFSYTSYRQYLHDYYEERKAQDAGFSYQSFARLCGFQSRQYIKMVIDGDRNLPVDKALDVANGLGLSFDETKYFEALVLFEQFQGSEKQKYYRRRLKELRASRDSDSHVLEAREILAHWASIPILAVADGLTVAEAPSVIGERLCLETAEAGKMLKQLCESRALLVEEGTYRLPGQQLTFIDRKKRNQLYQAFLGEQLQRSQEELKKNYTRGAQFFAHTFTIEKENLDLYRDEIQNFLDQLSNKSNREVPERVVQLNIQLFPYSK